MKIAILHAGDLKSLALGGVDQYIKNIIRNKGNNEIIVFGTCRHGEYDIGCEYQIDDSGLEYTFFPVSDDSVRPLTLGYLKNELRFLNKISQADIIYAQRIELSLPFMFCRKAYRKLIQVVHGSSYYTTLHWGRFKSCIYNFAEKISIKLARETYVVLMRKEFGVPYYKQKYKKLADKISYTKIPVDTGIFKHADKEACRTQLNLPKEKFIIMFGGRVEDYPKRVFLLPDILKQLNTTSNDYYLVVVGGGDDLKELNKRLAENNNSTYKIVGYTESRAIFVQYLNACDVNINISEFEGTCTSSLEAIACGAYVVSSDAGDIALFVANGKDGFIIENESETIVQNSVKAIRKIKEGNLEKSEMYKNYECSVVVDQLIRRFQSILDGGTRK